LCTVPRMAASQCRSSSSGLAAACLLTVTLLAVIALYPPDIAQQKVELEAKLDGPKKGSTAHSASTTRGRVHHHDAGADSAKRLKEKAEKADHEARKLRQEAAAKYDSSQELSRQAGIISHRVGRVARKEASLHSSIEEEEKRVKEDVHKLAQAVVMKQDLVRLKAEDDKDLQRVQEEDKQLALAHTRLARDQRREKAMVDNVAVLLKKASSLASEAVASLSRSHSLRLSSESDVSATSTVRAAHSFQQANTLRIASSKQTRKALDERSKARLDQEYVAILKQMVGKDKTTLKVDAGMDSRAKEREQAVRDKVRRTSKTLLKENRAAIRQDRDTTAENEKRDKSTLSEDEGKVKAYSDQAEREEKRAMHLLHASHRLQAEAARKLSLSTSDIQLEEEQA